MNVLRVQTQLKSQYRVLDISGRLPFNIVFALCRRSTDDTDPRNIDFRVPQTILDVPYAFLNALLILHPRKSSDAKSDDWEEVDLSPLRNGTSLEASPPGLVLLPSKVNETGEKFKSFMEYR